MSGTHFTKAALARFRGSFPALVTPFKNGRVDEKALREHVEWQIGEGTHGLVPVGTTGECPTVSHEEHHRVVEIVIDQAKGRVPVIAGAGSNATVEAVELAQHAQRAGADAVLVVMPYYNKPTQEGMFAHFKAINDAVSLPIFAYNVPGRTIVDMNAATMGRISKLKNVVGVKDATSKLERVTQHRATCGHDFIQLSGEDATTLGFMAMGGVGCISVTANVAPRLCADFQNACLKGDWETARTLQDKLMPLHDAMFIEPSPGPVKAALKLLGRMDDEQRLPLIPVSEATREVLKAALRHAGLLN